MPLPQITTLRLCVISLMAHYDTNFGSFGRVATDIGNSLDVGLGVAIQTDGKIVVAGYTVFNSNAEFAGVRYLVNGSLDNSFDADGKVITPIGFANDIGVAVAIETGGKILVAGYSEIGDNAEFAIVRYNSTGALDNSYGSFGKIIADVSNGGNDFGNAIALDTFGRAVVAGEANGLFGVVRILGDFAPTAAQVSVSGRVLTPIGRGLTNAVVLVTDIGGNTRAARTTTFGYFQFEEVEAGQTYIFRVHSKRYRFAPQVITITEDFDGLYFTAEP